MIQPKTSDEELTLPSILVAMPAMVDENFSRSVLLLIDHADDGAFGVIINRPTALSLRKLVPSVQQDIPEEVPTWLGGPVRHDSGIVLHAAPPLEGDRRVGPHCSLATSEAALLRMIAEMSARIARFKAGELAPAMELIAKGAESASGGDESALLYPWRFIVGYAGWGPGQLTEELRSGAWFELPFDKNLVYNTPWSQMWEAAFVKTETKSTAVTSVAQPWLN